MKTPRHDHNGDRPVNVRRTSAPKELLVVDEYLRQASNQRQQRRQRKDHGKHGHVPVLLIKRGGTSLA